MGSFSETTGHDLGEFKAVSGGSQKLDHLLRPNSDESVVNRLRYVRHGRVSGQPVNLRRVGMDRVDFAFKPVLTQRLYETVSRFGQGR
jgi:hypothetical protein